MSTTFIKTFTEDGFDFDEGYLDTPHASELIGSVLVILRLIKERKVEEEISYLSGISVQDQRQADKKAAQEEEDARILENALLNQQVDDSLLELFNSLQKCVSSSFRIPPTRGVAAARSIVSTWAPATRVVRGDLLYVMRQYAFSKFFDRFVAANEGSDADTRKLELSTTKECLMREREGAVVTQTLDRTWETMECLEFMREDINATLGAFDVLEAFSATKHGANGTATQKRKDAYLDDKYDSFSGSYQSLLQMVHYSYWDVNLRSYLLDNPDFILIENHETKDELEHLVSDATKKIYILKKFDTLRGINKEHIVPANHAQGVATCLTRRLRSRGIFLSRQPKLHAVLAVYASLFPEMGLMTLDWKEASERIWLALVERVIPEVWFSYMTRYCRSEKTDHIVGSTSKKHQRVPSHFKMEFGVYGEVLLGEICSWNPGLRDVIVRVHSTVFCTMGNALTFPLQTLIFHSFLTFCSNKAKNGGGDTYYSAAVPGDCFVSSFGDDGILNSDALPYVRQLAPLLGWVVNESKTYDKGDFRESCGTDSLSGYDVRPLMMKRPGTNASLSPEWNRKVIQSWVYVAANAAIDLCERLSGNADFIYKWLEDFHKVFKFGKICVVPPSYPEGAGLRIARDLSVPVTSNEDLVLVRPCDYRLYNLPIFILSDKNEEAVGRFRMRRLVAIPAKRLVKSEYPFLHAGLKRAPISLEFDDSKLDDGIYTETCVISSKGCVADKDASLSIIKKVPAYSPSWL